MPSEPQLTPIEIIVPEGVEQNEDALFDAIAQDDTGINADIDTPDSDSEDNNDDTAEQDDDAEDDADEEDGEEEQDDDAEDDSVREVVDGLQTEADACAAFLNSKGVDYNALVEEYQADGKLSRVSLEALTKAGIGEDLIKGYIDGQQARMDVYANRVKTIAGGEAEYGKLMRWASTHLSDKEIKHYDKAVESHDIDEARFALEALIARRDKEVGIRPNLLKGRSAKVTQAPKGFRSLEEMAAAQDDPRYETDEAYTRLVERRMLASDF